MTKVLILSVAVIVGIGVVALCRHTWRKLSVGLVDAVSLASKTAVPNPRSARGWPELRIDSVSVAPGDHNEALVEATWPGRPENRATLVVLLDNKDQRVLHLLEEWRLQGASVVPMPLPYPGIELRRRGRNARVHATVVAETYWRAP